MKALNKSIARRYFITCTSMVGCSILILGVMIMVFAASYFTTDKVSLLKKNVQKSSQVAAQSYAEYSFIERNTMENVFDLLSNSINSTFFLTNLQGDILLQSENRVYNEPDSEHSMKKIPVAILERIYTSRSKELYDLNYFEDAYSQKHYTYGCAILSSDTKKPIGYLFASTNVVNELGVFLGEILRMIVISSISVIILSFIVAFLVAMKMVRPLRQMSIVAKKIGSGDFTARVPVTTNDEIGQLATELNNMAKSISAQESIQRSFTANVSHELKTPMTSIAGFIDGILDGTIGPDQQDYYLKLVSDEVKRLSRLVKTMLNLSKIEAGQMNLNKISFNILDVIIQVLISFEKDIFAKNIEILGLDRDNIIIDADIELMTQVIYNLVENAVKFTNESGYIEFRFEHTNNYLVIAIKNSGEGLADEDRKKVFERFYKSDRSRGLDKNGVGLGLYIVRSIVLEHGGDVNVTGVHYDYTEFKFTIPCLENPFSDEHKN